MGLIQLLTGQTLAERIANQNSNNNYLKSIIDDTKDSKVTFAEASSYTAIASGDSHSTMFGKIKKGLSNIITMLGNVSTSYPIQDYIVAQGTSGIWTYRKWNSGAAECWTTSTQSGSWTCNSALGGWYKDTNNWPATVGLPFTFVKKPIVHVNIQSSDGIYERIERSTTTAALFFLITLQSHAAETIVYDIHCSGGTWK